MRHKTGFHRTVGDTSFIVYYNSQNHEYSVRVSVDTKTSHIFDPDRTYFTSDNDDAELTCIAMWKEEQKNQVARSDKLNVERDVIQVLVDALTECTTSPGSLGTQSRSNALRRFGAINNIVESALSKAQIR